MTPGLVVGRRRASIGVPVGAALMIVALIGSAVVVPQLRLLHFFQALIYLAIVYLARRGDASAFGAGFTIAAAWNGLQLLVTHNAQAGFALWLSFLETGEARRIDTMFVAVGTVGHFILIVACLATFFGRSAKPEWLRFFAGAVAVLVYFAVIVATLLPR